jgi:hypothetical protein
MIDAQPGANTGGNHGPVVSESGTQKEKHEFRSIAVLDLRKLISTY